MGVLARRRRAPALHALHDAGLRVLLFSSADGEKQTQARLGPYSEIALSSDERGARTDVKLRIELTEWSEGREQRVPGLTWLGLESEGGCVCLARREHNTVRWAVQPTEVDPEAA
jgi:hypothetical protein